MIDDKLAKEIIAKRVAREFKNGQLINLGIGLPTMVANYIPKDIFITVQSENGLVGMSAAPKIGNENKKITNAGGSYVTVAPTGAFFDSAISFGLIRGGHVDITILGALEVDEKGNLASWKIPGKKMPGMGGAMDLVVGSKKVIVAMQHTAKGSIKILENCTLPLTAKGVVDMIITELCVLEVSDFGLILKEIHTDTKIEEIQSLTAAKLIIPNNLKNMEF